MGVKITFFCTCKYIFLGRYSESLWIRNRFQIVPKRSNFSNLTVNFLENLKNKRRQKVVKFSKSCNWSPY